MPPDQNSRTAKAFLCHREVGDGISQCRAHVMLYSNGGCAPVMMAPGRGQQAKSLHSRKGG